MHVENSNNRLHVINCIGETGKFEDKLKEGFIKLDGAKNWLKTQTKGVHEHNGTTVLNGLDQMRELLHDEIVRWWRSQPVTLWLDRYRLRFAHENLNFLCTASSVVYTMLRAGGSRSLPKCPHQTRGGPLVASQESSLPRHATKM